MSDTETPRQDHDRDGASGLPTAPSASGLPARRPTLSRKGVWAGVAVLCLAAGTAGSVLQAQNVQRRDAAKARAAFQQTSTGIASTLKLALQREEDLAVSVSTFFAGHPKASRAEFTAWAYWAHALRRYPELERLNLVALVRAPELAAFET